MKKENKKNIWRVVFHGVNDKKTADEILKKGFRKRTYFARHLEDALCFGGRYIFYVILEVKGNNWQIVEDNPVSSKRIQQLIDIRPKELYYQDITEKYFGKSDKIPCSKCGADIGGVRLSILGKPVKAKCPKCGKIFNN